MNFGRDEPVVDEKILVHVERRVAAFEIAGPIVGDAMAQRQILCARRSPDGISLDEAELV